MSKRSTRIINNNYNNNPPKTFKIKKGKRKTIKRESIQKRKTIKRLKSQILNDVEKVKESIKNVDEEQELKSKTNTPKIKGKKKGNRKSQIININQIKIHKLNINSQNNVKKMSSFYPEKNENENNIKKRKSKKSFSHFINYSS